MGIRHPVIAAALWPVLLGLLAQHATAYDFRARFVRREGTTDTPIDADSLDVAMPPSGLTLRIRLQIGVFDDQDQPVPAGGVIGWQFGAIDARLGTDFQYTRTPGRLAPFNSNPAPGANGAPPTDPFTFLLDIDNTLGTQSPAWPAGSNPNAPPLPLVRGFNSFVSIYEISISPHDPGMDQQGSIIFSGETVAAHGWSVLGTPIPPTPSAPGEVQYAPELLLPIPFQRTLNLRMHPVFPAPSSGVLVLGLVVWSRRRPDASRRTPRRRGSSSPRGTIHACPLPPSPSRR